MMIVVANLRISGFFALVNAWVARRVHRPLLLLAAIVAVSGVFSAFLVNDAICLVMAPLVLELTLGLKRNPVPYLLAVAMASNVGSTATITGNPQNMMIGSFSRIPVPAVRRRPGAGGAGRAAADRRAAGTAASRRAARWRLQDARVPRLRINHVLMIRALMATALVVALFFAGQPPAKAAIIVGALLLLTRRVKSARVYAEIDWSLLLMFAGLFIIVAGAERELLTPQVVEAVGQLHLATIPVLSLVTAMLSNLVSNVPAVLLLKPFVAALPDQDRAWLVIAMASTLAGNFTVLGSIANLIVVEKAARRGVVIGFWDYFRVGAPLTLLTLAGGNVLADVALKQLDSHQERRNGSNPSARRGTVAGCSRRRDRGSQAGRQSRAELDRHAGQRPCRRDGAAWQPGCGDRRCDLHRGGQSGERT